MYIQEDWIATVRSNQTLNSTQKKFFQTLNWDGKKIKLYSVNNTDTFKIAQILLILFWISAN